MRSCSRRCAVASASLAMPTISGRGGFADTAASER
jgi:hypothetical protein